MSDLFCEVGYSSILHDGEQLCGDHVDSIRLEDGTLIVVLADGLGSGVKASILSTMTAKIISTMLSQGMSIRDAVHSIAEALPVDAQKGVAYSTFTIMRVLENERMEIIQYENPGMILLRNGKLTEFPVIEVPIGEKRVLRSVIQLQAGDVFVAVSDGCTNASASVTYNYDWSREAVADYVKIFAPVGYTAKMLASMVTEECMRLYAGHPRDDATACIVRVRERETVNVLFGPPSDPAAESDVIHAFADSKGRHIICGGTTSKVAAKVLGKEIRPVDGSDDPGIPPISEMDGIDLVTEGIVTMNRVNEYAKDCLGSNEKYAIWSTHRDGASLISRMLLEEGTDIRFFIGRAVNHAHDGLAYGFDIKMKIVHELIDELRKIGKNVTVRYD